jgi:hypothetical protein
MAAGWADGGQDTAGDGDDNAEGETVDVARIILNHIGFEFAPSPFLSALGQVSQSSLRVSAATGCSQPSM